MSIPIAWEAESNLTIERRMELLVREIMSVQTAINSYCSENEAEHAVLHCINALNLAVDTQNTILNLPPDKPVPLFTYYFTFTLSNIEHCGHFVKIEAEDFFAAREVMVKHFGTNWAFQYSEHAWTGADGVSQAEKYGYTELELPNE